MMASRTNSLEELSQEQIEQLLIQGNDLLVRAEKAKVDATELKGYLQGIRNKSS